jgi:hypothetical protein
VKAGVSYNVFNGEEHLLASLAQVRSCVEHINLVVQYRSYIGRPCSAALYDVLAEARREGLYDVLHEYEPDTGLSPKLNELAKRSIGLEIAKAHGATHFMTMDCDEYYVPTEFAAARDFIVRSDVRTTAVATYLHIRRPIWRSREPDTTYCAFLTEIGLDSRLVLNAPYPVAVDPKRRLHGDEPSFHLFDPAEIAMRHMNLVRLDLTSKLENSPNAGNLDFMSRVAKAYSNWTFGEPLRFPGKPPMEIVETPDLFGIDHKFAQDLSRR